MDLLFSERSSLALGILNPVLSSAEGERRTFTLRYLAHHKMHLPKPFTENEPKLQINRDARTGGERPLTRDLTPWRGANIKNV